MDVARVTAAGGLARRGLRMAAGAMVGAAFAPRLADAAAPTAMGCRRLGPLEVSALALGTMNFTGTYGPRPSREVAIRVTRAAFAKGVEPDRIGLPHRCRDGGHPARPHDGYPGELQVPAVHA